MSTILETLKAETIAAMKAGDKEKRDALRLLSNAFNGAIKEKGEALTADEELSLLTREAKKRREAIESYEQGGREEQAAKERAELAIIVTFLPKQLSAEEVEELIDRIIAKVGATEMKDMGSVMRELMPAIRGQYDAKLAKEIVVSKLR